MMSISFRLLFCWDLCHDIVMMRESSGVKRERDVLAVQRQKRFLSSKKRFLSRTALHPT